MQFPALLGGVEGFNFEIAEKAKLKIAQLDVTGKKMVNYKINCRQAIRLPTIIWLIPQRLFYMVIVYFSFNITKDSNILCRKEFEKSLISQKMTSRQTVPGKFLDFFFKN